MAGLLRNKADGIYIWCHANQVVQRYGLSGLCSGMFISEVGEAICYGFDDLDWDMIDESKNGFASIVSKYIDEPLDILYRNLMDEYSVLAQTNPIARFNMERLYLTMAGLNNHTEIINLKGNKMVNQC